MELKKVGYHISINISSLPNQRYESWRMPYGECLNGVHTADFLIWRIRLMAFSGTKEITEILIYGEH